MTFPSEVRRAAVVGTGLIGASVGLALRRAGWKVTGRDRDPARAARARELGALDATGDDPDAAITFIATPVGEIVPEARSALGRSAGVVTDVGGVKARIVSEIDDARFIGGHPMAGSEQDGLDGAEADLFRGATWVLTPTESTDPGAYAAVHAAVSSLGAHVIALDPARHDALVAIVSHVPHLTAAALMTLASEQATQHAALLRLAAGGFRDMTRIAAGDPGIWPDVCVDNSPAIVSVLDELVASLGHLRRAVVGADRDALLAVLERAKVARRNLPGRSAGRAEELVEVRLPVPDRVGVIAEVTTVVSELGASIADIETVHSPEGDAGVLVFVVDASDGDAVRRALSTRGYRPSLRRLG